MSFESTLLASTAWPAHLVSVGVVSTTGQVTSGRKPADKIDRRGMVWIEGVPVTRTGDAQQVRAHGFNVHYLYPSNLGSAQDGEAQQAAAELKATLIRDTYDGQNPTITGVSNVVSMSASDAVLDADPAEPRWIDTSVLVTFFVKE